MKLSTFQWIPLLGVLGIIYGLFSYREDNIFNQNDNAWELVYNALMQGTCTGLFLMYVVVPNFTL